MERKQLSTRGMEDGRTRAFRKLGVALLASAALGGCRETVHYSNDSGPEATDSRVEASDVSGEAMDAGPPVPLCEDGNDSHLTLRISNRVSFNGGYTMELIDSGEYDAEFALWDPGGLEMGLVQISEGPDTVLSLPTGAVRFAACTIRPGQNAGEGFVLLESDADVAIVR